MTHKLHITAFDTNRKRISVEALKQLGEGKLGYIRSMKGSEVAGMIPQAASEIPHDATLWALLSADGQPIMISDNRAALEVNASEHNLDTVSRH